MTTTDTGIQALAQEAYDWFERAQRPPDSTGTEGESFYRLKEGRPEWVYDLVREAHGEFLPDDWRYDCIHSALIAIADDGDPEDGLHEFADGQVDVYNAARVAWLDSSLYRGAYCDEAAQEFGAEGQGVYEMIGLGQFAEASEVYSLVLQQLEARAEEVEDEDEDETEDELTYSIVRFHFSGESEVLDTGQTLAEAQEHCNREDSHGEGWFDGYRAED